MDGSSPRSDTLRCADEEAVVEATATSLSGRSLRTVGATVDGGVMLVDRGGSRNLGSSGTLSTSARVAFTWGVMLADGLISVEDDDFEIETRLKSSTKI